ncbi:uncharacterized protein BKA78DRAFT_349597 [Phyllosticta capitalensis]|uniref:uncharacterized protein n=1 Tax=Phyllosticta capitalensis TaxID=121624 RepID=UPI00312F4803
MSKKIFPWTRKERRNALKSYRVDGLMPVAMYEPHSGRGRVIRKRKKSHRPKPHNIAIPSPRTSFAACFAPPSVLHDAALTSVSSASHLVAAAATDMLRSPALNNVDSPKSVQTLAPTQYRANTAPSLPGIAELPGSLLQENQGFLGDDNFQDEYRPTVTERTGSPRLEGQETNLATRLAASRKRGLTVNTGAVHADVMSPGLSTSGTQASKMSRRSGDSRSTSFRSSDFMGRRGIHSDNSSMFFMPLTEITEGSSVYGGSEGCSTPSKTSNDPEAPASENLQETLLARNKTIFNLRSQFVNLRKSHKAHIRTLVDAHTKDIDAMKSYIDFLENSREKSPGQDQDGEEGAVSKPVSSDPPQLPPFSASSLGPRTRAKEGDTRMDDGRDSAESSNEFEELAKVKKSLYHANCQIQAMKEQMEDLVAKKDSYKERAVDFEVRVRNNAEIIVDLRDIEYKLESENRKLQDRAKKHKEQLETLRSQHQEHIKNIVQETEAAKHYAELLSDQLKSRKGPNDTKTTVAELLTMVESLNKALREKNTRIQELERLNRALQMDHDEMEHKHSAYVARHDEALSRETKKRRKMIEKAREAETQITGLKALVEEQGKELKSVQAEYERLRKLLHAELRNQAKEALSRGYVASKPSNNEEYFELILKDTRKRVQDLIAQEGGEKSWEPAFNPYERVEQLEKEIEFHVRDLIHFKREARGFKKDVKRANSKISDLSASLMAVSAEPSPGSALSAPTQQFLLKDTPERRPNGLGIMGPSKSADSPEVFRFPASAQTLSANTTMRGVPHSAPLPPLPPTPSATTFAAINRSQSNRQLREEIPIQYTPAPAPPPAGLPPKPPKLHRPDSETLPAPFLQPIPKKKRQPNKHKPPALSITAPPPSNTETTITTPSPSTYLVRTEQQQKPTPPLPSATLAPPKSPNGPLHRRTPSERSFGLLSPSSSQPAPPYTSAAASDKPNVSPSPSPSSVTVMPGPPPPPPKKKIIHAPMSLYFTAPAHMSALETIRSDSTVDGMSMLERNGDEDDDERPLLKPTSPSSPTSPTITQRSMTASIISGSDGGPSGSMIGVALGGEDHPRYERTPRDERRHGLLAVNRDQHAFESARESHVRESWAREAVEALMADVLARVEENDRVERQKSQRSQRGRTPEARPGAPRDPRDKSLPDDPDEDGDGIGKTLRRLGRRRGIDVEGLLSRYSRKGVVMQGKGEVKQF